LALPERSLTFRAARPADPRTRARVDPEIGTRQQMPMLAMRLDRKGHVFRMGNDDQWSGFQQAGTPQR
jgi:hypothetical protein